MPKRSKVFERARHPSARKLHKYDKKPKEVLPIRRTPEYKAFYKEMLNEHPVCANVNCFKASTDIHHIKRVADYPELVFMANNVICVCDKCHDLIESAVNRGIDPEIWKAQFEGLE